jgi:hypothetical protein
LKARRPATGRSAVRHFNLSISALKNYLCLVYEIRAGQNVNVVCAAGSDPSNRPVANLSAAYAQHGLRGIRPCGNDLLQRDIQAMKSTAQAKVPSQAFTGELGTRVC